MKLFLSRSKTNVWVEMLSDLQVDELPHNLTWIGNNNMWVKIYYVSRGRVSVASKVGRFEWNSFSGIYGGHGISSRVLEEVMDFQENNTDREGIEKVIKEE